VAGKLQVAEKPKMVESQYPQSPPPPGGGWGEGGKRKLTLGKHQSCRQPVEFHRLFTMPKDDFVCAGMRQFLSVPAKGRLKPV